MVIRTRFRRIALLVAFHTIVLGASGFFAWHAYTGDRGIIARREHKLRIAQLNRQLDEVRLERHTHERRVNELAFDEVARDLLDERARAVLNLAHRNDLVILLDKR